jgi:hypothetical protein
MEHDIKLPLILNQASLQAYLDCPRKYELDYLNNTSWPAAPSSPLAKYETLTELGNRFHQLCQQFFIGLDPQLISSAISDPALFELWQAFLPYGQTLLKSPVLAEQILRIPFKNHFLVAKFDLIVKASPSEYLIIDWKTSSSKPNRNQLANRVQTFLYPFIFKEGGSDLFSGEPISSSAVKLSYWYPLADKPEEIFPYSDSSHKDIYQKISGLIKLIEDRIDSNSDFPLTDDLKLCNHCHYRSFCERGSRAHSLPPGVDLESEDLSNMHYDLDLIGEIEF